MKLYVGGTCVERKWPSLEAWTCGWLLSFGSPMDSEILIV